MFPESQFVFPGNLSPNAPTEMFAAIGRDSQYISVVPSQNLVWIRMGESPDGLNVPILMIDDIWELVNALPCEPNRVTDLQADVMQIYPNPSASCWNISCNQAMHDWVMCDQTGRTVASGNAAGKSQFTVLASEFNAGLYLCSVKLADGTTTRETLICN
jgi:hypothetical protein